MPKSVPTISKRKSRPRLPEAAAVSGTLTSELAAKIQDEILEQGLAEGQHYMTEEGISRKYTASRRVVREAVGQLRALGLLRARQRKGLQIGQPDPVRLLGQGVRFYGRSEDDFRRLGQVRYTLEIGAIDLAVMHATEEHVARLEELAATFVKIARLPPDAPIITETEYAFHRTILEATGNPLIAGFHGVILDFFRAESSRPTGRKAMPTAEYRKAMANSVWQHGAIAAAFRNRDLEQARAILRHHLRSYINNPDLEGERDLPQSTQRAQRRNEERRTRKEKPGK